ncbi:MAG: septum formation initiator family protein [Chloroflexi bacterium]|nr:septum formation initiator family protein [Chloroflexota bacterium]
MKGQGRRLPLPPTDIVTVMVCTAVVFFTLAFGGKALEGYRLQRQNARLKAEIAALQEKQQELQADLEHVRSPDYVEEVAREQYRWTKAGEKLMITIFCYRPTAEGVASSPPAPSGSTSSPPTSYWPEWWKLLTMSFD